MSSSRSFHRDWEAGMYPSDGDQKDGLDIEESACVFLIMAFVLTLMSRNRCLFIERVERLLGPPYRNDQQVLELMEKYSTFRHNNGVYMITHRVKLDIGLRSVFRLEKMSRRELEVDPKLDPLFTRLQLLPAGSLGIVWDDHGLT